MNGGFVKRRLFGGRSVARKVQSLKEAEYRSWIVRECVKERIHHTII